MAQLAKLSQVFIILCCCIVLVVSNCVLEFPANRENVPSYQKLFGTKNIPIPQTESSLVFQQGETITGYCPTTFSNFSCSYEERFGRYNELTVKVKVFTELQTVSLYCDNTKIHTSNGHKLVGKVLKCADLAWGMYESVIPFSWCHSTLDSYILASKYVDGAVRISAAVCLDLNKMSLTTLHYSTGPKNLTNFSKDFPMLGSIALSNVSLGAEVNNFGSVFDQLNNKSALQQDLYQSQDMWLKLANYQYYAMVHMDNTKHGAYGQHKYQTLLNVIWWENLHFGNWKRFMDALQEQAINQTFNVFVGTSGVVWVPPQDKCTQRDFLELRLGKRNTTVPAYIWTYVQSLDSKEEFVFIGYNSPFFDFFAAEDVIFCEDICGQVAWLKDIRSTFRYSTLGVTFCCSAEAVRSTGALDGFPLEVHPIVTSESTPILEELTTIDAVSEMRRRVEEYDFSGF